MGDSFGIVNFVSNQVYVKDGDLKTGGKIKKKYNKDLKVDLLGIPIIIL